MASTQVENQQMDFPVGSESTIFRNSGTRRFDPSSRVVVSGQGPSIGNVQTTESQGSGSQLSVKVTVLRAYNIPHKKQFGLLRRRFYVTVADHATMRQTRSVQIDGQTVQWDQVLDAFFTQRSSHLTLCLYEKKRFSHNDVVIGTHDIPVESKNDAPFVLSNGDEKAGQSIQPTIFLTITVPANMASESRISSNNLPNTRIEGGDSPADGVTKPSMSPDFEGPIRSTAFEPPLPSSDLLPVEPGTPILVRENAAAAVALRHVDNTMKSADLANTWRGVVSGIKLVMDSVSQVAELHPFAKMAYALVSVIPETLLEQYQRDDNVRTLLQGMHDAFDFAHLEGTLTSIKSESRQAQILMLMLQGVCNCCDFIQSYSEDTRFWKRMLRNMGGMAGKEFEDLSVALIDHKRALLDFSTITTETTTFEILDDVGILSAEVNGISSQVKWVSSQVSDSELDAKIRDIPYGTGARFRPEKGCLPGTRTAFLDFIADWVNDPASERCLVLFGQAGTGKSSIAHEIARRFDKVHRLTSSFVFLRKEQSRRESYHLFTTLARDLADRYPSFKTALGKVVKDNTSLRTGTRDYGTLFESLILEPLKDLHIVGPILVVIDALDESGDATGRNGLHTFLAKALIRLPSNFRVLITSRPEDGIESAFVGAPSIRIKFMNDPELAAETHDDILAFLRERLPSDEFKNYGGALAAKAEGSFQWAAVASQFILYPPERFGFSKRMTINHLLNPRTTRYGQDPLDELYKEVLEGYFTYQASRLLFRSVLGQLITSIEPLTVRSLTTLRQRVLHSDNDDDDGDAVVMLLRRLGSLLSNVNSSNKSLPIVPLHTSFRDFLTNKEKSGDFWVDLRDAHYQLAHSCLIVLIYELKFNICNLESPYLPNKDIEDLNDRLEEYISPALSYACRFWDDHLEHLGFETDLFGKLRTFFGEKFLFWLEALSLTSNVGLASPAFLALNAWLESGRDHVSQMELEEFRSFVNDASVFVRYFGMAMAKSAPHIYLSALPFAPARSLVSAHYSGSFPRILHVERGQLSHWPSSEMEIPDVGGKILSISFSPDGQRIVSGSDDGTIRVWNATTGETTAVPFTGHVDLVRSVAFSPDFQRIVSGSNDGTIRVRNATTGETEVGPFTGHSDSVWSVAFSPDGRRIVSGSSDGTVHVWDATTGETEAGPFTGHADSIRSVAFSPDGQYIVSGSDDETVRVWNATTGETAAGPFTGHTSSVWSVAFSPDGQRIVSSSDDGTIRLWKSATGETVTDPFTRHTSSVWSVAFSPDGQRIVSGSSDRTIRVWNATTGETAAGPFTGHTNSVLSVAFSPDGQRIVSYSDDGTIRVWNTTGETAAARFTGHTDSVLSVAFSPDDKRIVSGSSDRTICVWNVTTGETAAGPFIGHSDSVRSVAFSPDSQYVVSGSDDQTIRVRNAMTGETAAGTITGHTDSVWFVAFSPDGQRIVSGSDDRAIRVWNATTGELVATPFTGHGRSVTSMAFSPDGQRIASGLDDRTIRVRDATTGKRATGSFIGHADSVRSVAFSPDGQRIVSGSDDRTIRVWDITTGETEAGPFVGHTDSIRSLAFSQDGKHVVSGSDDRTIRVWDSTTGETVAGPFTGHSDSVRSVAFSPDGQYVVSGSHDGSIRLWTASATTGGTKTIGDVDFTDDSIINNEGWICGRKGELLLWIPPIHRAHLHRPSNIWVAGENETRVDLSSSAQGHSWTTCVNTLTTA